jgi:glycosyltransferase involved in cell wall biosynthesis
MAKIIMYSLIIPVYKNEESLPDLLSLLNDLHSKLSHKLELIFVVDGSPDNSYIYLKTHLSHCVFSSRLILLSRNFGSFSAIRCGLKAAQGEYFAVMAADLQEPPELILMFFQTLEKNEVDITFGLREKRADPVLSRFFSGLFWKCYRQFIQRDIPPGGVDMFGCNRIFRDHLLELNESNSSLIGLLFWLGFRRSFIPYCRQLRKHGKSAWTFGGKLRYLSDSLFSFSDLPIRILIFSGILSILFSFIFGLFLIIAKISHWIGLPGYTTTILIILFFTGLNALGLGIIGSYVWRAFENSKRRPPTVIMKQENFEHGDSV